MNENIKQKITTLKDVPGSYQMRDKDNTIIYVGKAKSLKKRVSQYFLRPQSGKVLRMVLETVDFTIIETASEKEALLLEINLIHQHRPKYNIALMDDKSYPYIALKKDLYPYLVIKRKRDDKSFTYFGPFPDSSRAYKMIDLLNEIYPLRKCKNIPDKACLYYHLGQCLAPCIDKIDPSRYALLTNDVTRFMNGDTSKITSELKEKMNSLSKELRFEECQIIKEQLDMIDKITSKQNIIFQDKISRDIIGYSYREGYLSLVIIKYKDGVLFDKIVKIVDCEDDISSQIESLLYSFYSKTNLLAKEVIVPTIEIQEVLTEALNIRFIKPTRGRKLDLLLTANKNAQYELDVHFNSARLEDDVLLLLEELKDKLYLKKTPLDIELYDNSHLEGYDPVGVMVKFINGKKAPEMYRRYKIHQENSQDDLASMKEVLTRRFSRLKEEGSKLPDLIMMDGGETQCQVCMDIRDQFELDIPIVGLKKNDRHETDVLLNAETGEEVTIDRKSNLFFLLARMQDEVHRFAITFHRERRGKSLYKTIYDDVKGIGSKRKQILLELYPTVELLKEAKREDLEKILPDQVIDELLKKVENRNG